YVFLPPGVTNRWVQGELIFMNAKPFPDSRGELTRMIISRVGRSYSQFRYASYPEFQVQEIFKDAGIDIPKPPTTPEPPPARPGTLLPEVSFRDRAFTYIDALAMDFGIKSWVLHAAVYGLMFTVAAVLLLILCLPGRRAKRSAP